MYMQLNYKIVRAMFRLKESNCRWAGSFAGATFQLYDFSSYQMDGDKFSGNLLLGAWLAPKVGGSR